MSHEATRAVLRVRSGARAAHAGGSPPYSVDGLGVVAATFRGVLGNSPIQRRETGSRLHSNRRNITMKQRLTYLLPFVAAAAIVAANGCGDDEDDLPNTSGSAGRGGSASCGRTSAGS